MICKKCNANIPDHTPYCPNCGASVYEMMHSADNTGNVPSNNQNMGSMGPQNNNMPNMGPQNMRPQNNNMPGMGSIGPMGSPNNNEPQSPNVNGPMNQPNNNFANMGPQNNNMPNMEPQNMGPQNNNGQMLPGNMPNQNFNNQMPPKAPNPMMQNLKNTLKGMFSKDATDGAAVAGRSNSIEWLIYLGIFVLLFGLTFALNGRQLLLSNIAPYAMGQNMGKFISFGMWFLFGILAAVINYFITAFGTFLLTKVIYKMDVNINNVFNLVGSSTVIISIVLALNFILGFIWVPLTYIGLGISYIISLFYIYCGIQRIGSQQNVSFLMFALVFSGIIFFNLLFFHIFFNASVKNIETVIKRKAEEAEDSVKDMIEEGFDYIEDYENLF